MSIELCRLKDLKTVRLVLTDPDIYPLIGDDFSPPAEEFEVNDHPGIWYVGVYSDIGLVGLFMLIPVNPICWEVHVAMLPRVTGTREKWEAARMLPGWLAENTECRRLVAAVPASHWPAIVYGTHGIGLKYAGRHERAFMKCGQLQDLVLLGMPIGD